MSGDTGFWTPNKYTTPLSQLQIFFSLVVIYSIPIGSMYGVFTSFWLIFTVNVVNPSPMEYDNTTFSLQTFFFLILPLAAFFWCAVEALPFVALWPHLWFPRQRLSFDPPSAKGPGLGDINYPGRRGFSPPILGDKFIQKNRCQEVCWNAICLIGIYCTQCQLRDFVYQVFATNVRISYYRITVTILEDSEVL